MPGKRVLPAPGDGLPRDSVANVTAVVTINKDDLDGPAGQVPATLMHELDQGLRQVVGV